MTPALARALAGAYLADGDWTVPALVDRGALVVGRRRRWLGPLARQVLEVYATPPADRPRELAGVIAGRPAAERARDRPIALPAVPTRMVANPWHLPELHDVGDVAALLGLTATELLWFADPKHWARVTDEPRLQHYLVSTRPSASGAVRVLEAPRPRLKALQRRLLTQVLDPLPAHDAAHGFRRHRSVATYAAPHAGQALVVRLDLEGFFASVTVGRVYGVLRTAGYPEPVAHCLAGLVTSVLPRSAWASVPRPADPGLLDAHWRLGRRLAAPHLPQGAPTSPALANLAAYRLDTRLTGLAAAWGGRYTRYADDLCLSGGRSWGRGTSRLLDAVEVVVREEGFRLNARKTAVQPRGGRQVLGGLVVNERPHVGRAEVDLLRAVLHNCVRYGPSSQDRQGRGELFRAHLAGRVSWVAQHDAVRGARLQATLDAVDWTR